MSLTAQAAGARARRAPPLWLAAAVTAAAWGALYSAVRWIYGFVTFPIHEDIRIDYVAAEAGLRFGWSRIYDFETLRALSLVFPAADRSIDATATYISPPLLAWLFVPLTLVSEPAAYVLWTVLALAGLAWTWHVATPYGGLAKATLLLVALALWPVMQVFYYGQPGIVVLSLVALGWWLTAKGRDIEGGLALAVALMLKPQVVVMVPAALLAAGRLRSVAGFVLGTAVLAAVSAVALGQAGIASYWHALNLVQADPGHMYFTIAYVFGDGVLSYALLAVQGAACLFVAWRRRGRLDVVFATGLLGSLLVSFHLHQWDYSNLVLAAWLVLRTSPPLWHRAWLGLGIVTMQLLSLGFPVPQLAWDLAWLVMLGAERSAQGAPRAAAQPG